MALNRRSLFKGAAGATVALSLPVEVAAKVLIEHSDALNIANPLVVEQVVVATIAERDALAIPTDRRLLVFVQDAGDGQWALFRATAPHDFTRVANPETLDRHMAAINRKVERTI